MQDYIQLNNIGKQSDVELSICIPTYKRRDSLIKALESAIMQINGKLSIEIIIVSNDTEDDLHDLISKYSANNIYFFRNVENKGMVGNLNQCWKLAKGKYISFLHDDDYLLPGYLREIGKLLSSGKDFDCFINARYICSPSYSKNKIFIKKFLSIFYFFNKIYKKRYRYIDYVDCLKSRKNCFMAPTCGTIIKKESLEEFGGFEKKFNTAWDYYFFFNFSKERKVLLGSKKTSVYMLETGASKEAIIQYDFYIYEQYLLTENRDLKFVNTFYNELYNFNFYSCADATKRIVFTNNTFNSKVKFSRIKMLLMKIKRINYYYLHNLDAECIVRGGTLL